MTGEICHYTSLSGLNGIICKEGIKFFATRFSHLNDSLEYNWAKERLQPEITQELCDEFKLIYDKDMDAYPYVLCFSKDVDSLPLWQIYADNGVGFCLVFDRERIRLNGIHTNPDVVMDVAYTDVDNLSNTFRKVAQRYMTEYGGNNSHDLLDVCALIKRRDFTYENEVRYLLSKHGIQHYNGKNLTENEDYDDVKFRGSRYGLIPYLEIMFPKDCLKKIIVGYAYDFNRQRESLELLLNQLGYDNIDIQQAIRP